MNNYHVWDVFHTYNACQSHWSIVIFVLFCFQPALELIKWGGFCPMVSEFTTWCIKSLAGSLIAMFSFYVFSQCLYSTIGKELNPSFPSPSHGHFLGRALEESTSHSLTISARSSMSAPMVPRAQASQFYFY